LPDSFEVAFLPNKYASLSKDARDVRVGHEDFGSYGDQDVFLYSPCHDERIFDISIARTAHLLRKIGHKIREYYSDERIVSAFSFEVSGKVFGPSLEHPHGQTFGFSSPIPGIRGVSPAGMCMICQDLGIISAEGRLVAQNDEAVLFCPRASRFPLEMWLVPRHHCADLAAMSDSQRLASASLLNASMRRLRSFGWRDLSYMLCYVHPPRDMNDDWHFRIEICPAHRINGSHKCVGAMEISAGIYLNPTAPHIAADFLRGGFG
jgi:UDPglucose--hexose-1-phosphate uridylyltransferase